MKKKDLYLNAIAKYGEESQTEMIVEECSELIQAIQKLKRGGSVDHVCEEIADVEIMIDQARLIFDSNKINAFKKQKLDRLETRIFN